MASLNDLRKRHSTPFETFVRVHITIIKMAAQWFDVITDGGADAAQQLHALDLRVKFGPHAGKLVSYLAQSEKPYLRDLFVNFHTSPAVDTVFRAVVSLQLNESQAEIEQRLI